MYKRGQAASLCINQSAGSTTIHQCPDHDLHTKGAGLMPAELHNAPLPNAWHASVVNLNAAFESCGLTASFHVFAASDSDAFVETIGPFSRRVAGRCPAVALSTVPPAARGVAPAVASVGPTAAATVAGRRLLQVASFIYLHACTAEYAWARRIALALYATIVLSAVGSKLPLRCFMPGCSVLQGISQPCSVPGCLLTCSPSLTWWKHCRLHAAGF